MGVLLLLLTSPPSTLRVVGGGSAAGPSHSRTSGDVRLESTKGANAAIDCGRHQTPSSNHRDKSTPASPASPGRLPPSESASRLLPAEPQKPEQPASQRRAPPIPVMGLKTIGWPCWRPLVRRSTEAPRIYRVPGDRCTVGPPTRRPIAARQSTRRLSRDRMSRGRCRDYRTFDHHGLSPHPS